jgi:hypothetical protein
VSLPYYEYNKAFLVAAMAPWASAVTYGQGEKLSAWPTTVVKLRTSDCWVGTRTGAGITATIV